MDSNDIKRKIEMILGKKRVKNQKDYMKVYGVGLVGNQITPKKSRNPVSLREHIQRKRSGKVKELGVGKYAKLPKLSINGNNRGV